MTPINPASTGTASAAYLQNQQTAQQAQTTDSSKKTHHHHGHKPETSSSTPATQQPYSVELGTTKNVQSPTYQNPALKQS